MEKQINNPKLRFSEFKEEWKKKRLGEIGITVIDGDRGTNYPNGTDFSDEGYCLFMNAKNVTKNGFSFIQKSFITKEKDELLRKGKLQRFDIVITTRGSVGHISYYDLNVPFEHLRINSGMALIRTTNEIINSDYLYKYFNSNQIQNEIDKISFGSAQPQLTITEIIKLKISFPTLPEQTKIANFLTAVNDKLTQLKKKKSLLEQYKKGAMQKLFSQELRFKNENGDDFAEWEEKTLGEIAIKITTKNRNNIVNNVFTNSASQGIVNQRDFFDKDIANQNNLLNYYVVENNDFVYNPRISNFAPVGPISRNHLQTGVMSPLYSVFRIIHGNLDFFEVFFSTSEWHEYMESIANYGARADRMNITSSNFYLMPLPFPCHAEQTKIANFLSAIDDKINHCGVQIEKMEGWKKGLLQKMFV